MSLILVTGSTGNVGHEVVAQLLARNTSVRAAVRTGDLSDVDGASRAFLDFDDPSTFAGALAGVDKVFLMRPPRMSDHRRMRPFIDAMERAGVREVAFLSVQGAGTNPFVPHHGIERYLAKSRVPCTILRPSFFMQNLSTTHLADIRDRDEVFVPAGEGRTNFIDAGDIAEAVAVVLTEPGHAGKAYELTGGEALTYGEVAQALSYACGRKITYPSPSGRQFKERMTAAGHSEEFVRVMASIYRIARLGMAAGTTDELERLIGRPPTTLAEWARRNARCFSTGPGRLPATNGILDH